jgi:subtilisin family serine protease
MAKRKVIIEMRATPALWNAAQQPFGLAAGAVPSVSGVALDPSFPPTPVPSLVESRGGDDPADVSDRLALDMRPAQSTYLLRGELEDDPAGLFAAAPPNPDVVGVFADELIEPIAVCPGAPPVGTHQDVERALGVGALHGRGFDGRDVLVAIVDTGVNLAHLQAHGKNPRLDGTRSWSPVSGGPAPGQWPVDHGTMCAFDVCIAAPRCTLLDVALLRSSAGRFTAFLSDACGRMGIC